MRPNRVVEEDLGDRLEAHELIGPWRSSRSAIAFLVAGLPPHSRPSLRAAGSSNISRRGEPMPLFRGAQATKVEPDGHSGGLAVSDVVFVAPAQSSFLAAASGWVSIRFLACGRSCSEAGATSTAAISASVL